MNDPNTVPVPASKEFSVPAFPSTAEAETEIVDGGIVVEPTMQEASAISTLQTSSHCPPTIPPWPKANAMYPQRDEHGRWLKGTSGNEGNMSTGQKVAHWFRVQLEGLDPKDENDKMKLARMFENMFAIAVNTDAKSRKEAVWAFNALMERAYGPPVKDKTELDAMSKGGAQVQILVLPAAQPVHGPRELPTPKFDDDKSS